MEVESISDLSEKQKRILRETCEKIYMLESSVDLSNQQLVLDIKGEVSRRADRFKEAGK